jgi:hypothetical protein
MGRREGTIFKNDIFRKDLIERAIRVKRLPYIDLGFNDMPQEHLEFRIRKSHCASA